MKQAATAMNNIKKALQVLFVCLFLCFFDKFFVVLFFVWIFFPFAFGKWLAVRQRTAVASEASRAKAPSVAAAACAACLIAVQTIHLQ